VDYLTERITDDDVRHIELALVGKIHGTLSVEEQKEDVRDVLLRRTSRFHLVKAACWSNATGTIQYFECDCRDYYFHRWCFQSAYMQHRQALELLGQKLPNSGRTGSKYHKSIRVDKALQVASTKLRRKKYEQTQRLTTSFGT
jgi:hypothetical protein